MRKTKSLLFFPSDPPPPTAADLFGPEQLELHARELAAAHQSVVVGTSHLLIQRLQENEQILRTFNRATHEMEQHRRVTHAAEWILDNFYLIEEQIQIARRHLPRSYSRELPRLQEGPSAGLPRVYAIVRELISHSDAQVDADSLNVFISAYQSITTLKLGELWAVPIMLRLALIEMLRIVATRLSRARIDREIAHEWVGKLEKTAQESPADLVVVVAEMAKADLPLSSSFVAEFYKSLSHHNPAMQLARTWFEQRLAEHELSIEHLVQQESQTQAADQVLVSHTITSLRFLSATNWRLFVEQQSAVEHILRDDPAGVYAQMDFSTRDNYRHVVETLSRHTSHSETDVAKEIVRRAAAAADKNGAQDRTAHVGYYLIGRGVADMESSVRVRWPWRKRMERLIQNYPLCWYAGGIGLITIGALALALWQAKAAGIATPHLLWLGPVLLLCTSQLAVAFVNWLSSLLVSAQLMPRLDLSSGIGAELQTIVVIPTLLTAPEDIDRLLETLEIHYLANRDPHLHFALLTDFPDAPEEITPDDDERLQQVQAGIENLNEKYRHKQAGSFYLFHRARKWNAAEGRWMGYERKRGKLADFNAALTRGEFHRFSLVIGDQSALAGTRFVITLDSDTQLPHETAQQLIGAIAHPLNRPKFDESKGIVTEGYGILQPRVGVSLPSAGRSWFVRLFAGDSGIDPYTRVTSDVYQDVFQEGSFIGKGIYDVAAFDRAVRGRFPENTVLSHDLIESVHARSGLISDIELYEEYPSRYNADIERRHRWIRGDWQIAQWLLPRVPGPDARRIANPLSTISRWKILDNLRRSLVPPALLLLIVGDWLWLAKFNGFGILLALTIILLPGLLAVLSQLFQPTEDLTFRLYLSKIARSAGRQLGQAFLTVVFLPYDVLVCLDAIGRTLLRLFLTRKRLLEWQTASEAERTTRSDLTGFYATMWIAPALALLCMIRIWQQSAPDIWLFLPVTGLWCFAPWIAWRISQPIKPEHTPLDSDQIKFLRHTARRTWRYFEDFVTADDHWLPPDNFQEEPARALASRTSPTNLGLSLLANLAAWDFGYLTTGRLIERTQATFSSMRRLERFRGHFYNWYDTRSLQPLPPRYISSVDSGNLAGHLLVLSSGLADLKDQPVLPPQWRAGLRDTLEIIADIADAGLDLEPIEAALMREGTTLREEYSTLQRTVEAAERVNDSFVAIATSDEVQYWLQKLAANAQEHLDDLLALAPWFKLPTAPVQFSDPILKEQLQRLEQVTTAGQIADLSQTLTFALERELANEDSLANTSSAALNWCDDLISCLQEAWRHANQRLTALDKLSEESGEFAEMDFTFLFDVRRNLFTIGYNVAEHQRDRSYYDLLASEARLTSYVAIAQRQVPLEHWFSLSRLLVTLRRMPVLVSWSGSMFEYLMPSLVMPTYDNTLLDQTCRSAVAQQIEYGRMRRVPWGISESGYNLTDAQLNYQYRAFGVPGLGLKRGLSSDLVIAPYASLLALLVAPREACKNLERLAEENRTGAYGFYEAVDYTTSRLPRGKSSVTVRSFMVHHQGMGLLALAGALLDYPMQRRFLACPLLRATDLLLQERMPQVAPRVLSNDLELDRSRKLSRQPPAESPLRLFRDPAAHAPEVHLLSNGNYHVVISATGGGYSKWRDLAITRWREDSTRDCWGSFIYLRDKDSGEIFSAAHQPTLRSTARSEVIFTQARAEFRQYADELEMHTQICVSPDDDAEVRRLTLTNHSGSPRTIEVTSYAEIVLAPPAADAAHPAFSNLFVQTEFYQPCPAILATRRARSETEKPPWLFAMMIGRDGTQESVSCETDRSKFIGRNGTLLEPAALRETGPLSNTTGSVLDPVMALRRIVTVPPRESVRIDLITGVSETRDEVIGLLDKFQNPRIADRAFDLAWTHSQVTLRHLGATEADAHLFAKMASALIYANTVHRAPPAVLRQNHRGQSGLWAYGISGDLPVTLLKISEGTHLDVVRKLLQAHSYWRLKGLAVELVILNEDSSNYRQPLQDQIMGLISSGFEAQMLDKPAGIFVRRADQFSPEDYVLLQTVARLILHADNHSLTEQLGRSPRPTQPIPPLHPEGKITREPAPPLPTGELLFHNGLGGFTPDGREYIITLHRGQSTPAPWVNVIANPHFGTVVTESGGAYTWLENCHEFRITPWNNDPVSDASGEAFYLRDEQTGQFWSPTPAPAQGDTPYVIRHGFGYTVYEHTENGIASELWIYVAMDAPVKFAVLKLHNQSKRERRISTTGYWEWVLADLRSRSLLHVRTELDSASGALLAHNAYNAEFAHRIAFIDVHEPNRTLTGDRLEFMGRSGHPGRPAAMRQSRLSGKTGAGLDPCGAVQVTVDLAAGAEREIIFRLGVGHGQADMHILIQRFRQPGAARAALERVWDYWKQTIGAVQVETPDPSINLLANGWLLYQTLACRIWGRTGFYQSGGAYGFRDQLQDVMALVHAEPALTREHLLRAAAHQFEKGDVQHWWHPPAGRGVRTHFSDDYLWLPYATCRYVKCIGDTGVLNEKISFLEGRELRSDEEAYYDLPTITEHTATLYEHCKRAVEYGLKFGEHGLPLMGCGDWNDGMNLVGEKGRGESVWLAFFLSDVLAQFAELADSRNDPTFAARCREELQRLRYNIAQHAWDGAWYRRAYFDDGTPLGSATNEECQIDSLPQSWSVISGSEDRERSLQGMTAVQEHLVRPHDKLIQLFDPPFDHSALNPGYIKGYIPGVRENGGQYTHGAIWTTMAFALMGEHDRAWELFALLNPINHTSTPEQAATYKVEPYVVAADVYGAAPHIGRGGWTWYTGSAGWMYRLIIETLLGLQREGERLRITPRLPTAWTGLKITYRFRETHYHITFTKPEGSSPSSWQIVLDGQPLETPFIHLNDDHRDHAVECKTAAS